MTSILLVCVTRNNGVVNFGHRKIMEWADLVGHQVFSLGHVTFKMPNCYMNLQYRDLQWLLDINLIFRDKVWTRGINLGVVSG